MENAILNKAVKISIIVPVYNTEDYFERCIRSIMNQSYNNLEIIVINDGSTGDIDKMIIDYQRVDNRILYFKFSQNQGLFRARIQGIKMATGQYIGFVDSDDYISFDYFHRLLEQAIRDQSEIVGGRTVREDQDGNKYIYNLHDAFFSFDKISGEKIRNTFFAQAGNCFSWHTVWNKIYSQKLISKCIHYWEKIQDHIVMTEDILFSSVMFYFAESMSLVKNDAYFYCQNRGAATDSSQITLHKYKKNIGDIIKVFNYVDKFLDEVNAEECIKKSFFNERKRYGRIWRKLCEDTFKGNDLKAARELCEEFCEGIEGYRLQEDEYFDCLKTKWSGGLEFFKESIALPQYKYISFDIFDTLLQRPFFNPEDLFVFLEKKFEKYSNSNINFKKMRLAGEKMARESNANQGIKEVTLSEIYDCIEATYKVSHDVIEQMMQEEIRLEFKFCSVRKAGQELYELAHLLGKKILLISDMYLDKETIHKLLEKKGYSGFEELYVSSAEGILKYSGELFEYVLKRRRILPEQILHIGDSWEADILGAKKAGIDTLFFPKAVDVLKNKIEGKKTNFCGSLGSLACSPVQNANDYENSIEYTSMLAKVANKYFDNPYRSFNENSDLNGDPYFIGYYVLGMHLFSLTYWIIKQSAKNGYSKIYFASRDGWLPMKVYNLFSNKMDILPSEYLVISRRAVLAEIIEGTMDFYDLPIDYQKHSPDSMLKLLEFCTRKLNSDDAEILKKNKILCTKRFETISQYYNFINVFLEHFYCENKMEQTRKNLRKYYSGISSNAALFDMGYSGRIQLALNKICDKKIDALFVYADTEYSQNMSRKGKFNISTYYRFTPTGSGFIREALLAELTGSCFGFSEKNKLIHPVYEKKSFSANETWLKKCIYHGIEDFVQDYLNDFAEYREYMKWDAEYISYPFEIYIRYAGDVDIYALKTIKEEDYVYAAEQEINVYDFMKNQRKALDPFRHESVAIEDTFEMNTKIISYMNGKSKLMRGLIFLIFDTELFKKKLKKNIKRILGK